MSNVKLMMDTKAAMELQEELRSVSDNINIYTNLSATI